MEERNTPSPTPPEGELGSPPLLYRTGIRHALLLSIAALLVYAFSLVHDQFQPLHRWNRAFGDASVVLFAFAMTIGPAVRIWPIIGRVLAFRRESGIYASLLMLTHVGIILVGWVEWNVVRLFGFEFHPQLERYVMLQHGFGLANLVGLIAVVYALALIGTSNDRSVARLGATVWKHLQNGAVVLWMLAVVHVAYFLFIHFMSFHRVTPAPNPLQWPFVALVALVLVLRVAAFLRTWRPRRQLPAER